MTLQGHGVILSHHGWRAPVRRAGGGKKSTREIPVVARTTWCALYGFLLISLALAAYVFGVALGPVRWLLLNPGWLREVNAAIVWYSGIPLVAGTLLVCWDLFGQVREMRHWKSVRREPPANPRLTVVLTAYNDERSIGGAVRDFAAHPLVDGCMVISNNSRDRTMECAAQAGAIVFNEARQGYGACVHRALREALKFGDTELTLLCEGDLTFRAADIEKFWPTFRMRISSTAAALSSNSRSATRNCRSTCITATFRGKSPGTETFGHGVAHRRGHDV